MEYVLFSGDCHIKENFTPETRLAIGSYYPSITFDSFSFLEKENVWLKEENEVLKNICEELLKMLDQREEVHFIIPPFKYMLSIRTTFSNDIKNISSIVRDAPQKIL